MWAQYRKSFLISQLFILAVCATGFWAMGMHPLVVGMLFLTMQFGSLMGAWWGARLSRQMEARRNRLPLDR